jgi:hypothetical protein
MGSGGFEKVLIGTLGPRNVFTWGEEASGEEQRSGERRKTH